MQRQFTTIGDRRLAHPRTPPYCVPWMELGWLRKYRNNPEWDETRRFDMDDPEDAKEVNREWEALADATWDHAIEEGLPKNSLHDWYPRRDEWKWTDARARVLREIDLLGPAGVTDLIEDHKSVYDHPYNQLVKGAGPMAGEAPIMCGGGGGGGGN